MRFSLCIVLLHLGVCCSFVSAQVNLSNSLTICTTHPQNRGKYKVLSIASGGIESQIYLAVRPKDRNDENYIKIAKEFRERYCREAAFRLIYLRDKKQYARLKPFGRDPHPLAIFFWTHVPRTEKNGLVVYTVSEGNVEVRELVIDVPDPRK